MATNLCYELFRESCLSDDDKEKMSKIYSGCENTSPTWLHSKRSCLLWWLVLQQKRLHQNWCRTVTGSAREHVRH